MRVVRVAEQRTANDGHRVLFVVRLSGNGTATAHTGNHGGPG